MKNRHLTFLFPDGHGGHRSIRLGVDQAVVLGRSSTGMTESGMSFMTLDHPSVSRRHCEISFDGALFVVKDLGSSNGTYVNGQRIASGNPVSAPPGSAIHLGSNNNPGTEVLLSVGHGSMTGGGAEPAGERSGAKSGPTASRSLLELLGKKDTIVLGRSDTCDVTLPDQSRRISRRHAKVTRSGDRVFVEDLGSTNGTFIDSNRVRGKRELKRDQKLVIGLHIFYLDRKSVNLDGAVALSAMNLKKVYDNGYVGLQPLNLQVNQGEMVAIMGPSGCGKSTLLKMLCGEQGISGGTLKVMGQDLASNMDILSQLIGYVPQDDIVHRELTVWDTLYFACKVRLNPGISDKEIASRIVDVLQSVSLIGRNEVNNPKEGKYVKQKVGELSGGQRKRVSIAVELLSKPKLLFLDEPTSPLDPETISSFLECLKQLVKEGVTILMVTHKPEDLKSMDRVIFIGARGYQVFDGRPGAIVSYFQASSINEVYARVSIELEAKIWNQKLPNHARKSSDHRKLPTTIDKYFFHQTFWQTLRYLKVKLGNPKNLMLQMIQPLIVFILIALTFESVRIGNQGSNEDQANMLVMFLISLAAIWFGVSNSAKEIVSELSIYRRERNCRLRATEYLVSKTIVLSGILIVQLLIFLFCLVFWFDGELLNVQKTFAFLTFIGLSAVLFGLVLSVYSSTTEEVMSILPIALMPQIILSGMMSPIRNNVMELASYFTMGRWGAEGIMRIQEDFVEDSQGLKTLDGSLYSYDGGALGWFDSMELNAVAIMMTCGLYVILILRQLKVQEDKYK